MSLKKKKNVPIFRRVLIPLMVLIVTEILIFAGAIYMSGVSEQMSVNAMDVANGKLTARKNYLESVMINNWMNISIEVSELNRIMSEMVDSGEILPDEIGEPGEGSDAFLVSASDTLLGMMRSNRVTGAFLLLNRGCISEMDLEEGEALVPGIYLRDLDPVSVTSDKNTDILIERSPAAVVKKTGIATDQAWTSCFRFNKETGFYPFFYEPYTLAYKNPGKYEWRDLGYWSAPYSLEGENRMAISYSVPLTLEDGTVYGVLGADILLEYIETLLPSDELVAQDAGTYFIAQAKNREAISFTEIFETGDTDWSGDVSRTYARRPHTVKTYVSVDQDKYYHQTQHLEIYNSNVPYEDTYWVMGFVLPWTAVHENARRIQYAFLVSSILIAVIGLMGSLLIAYWLQKPVRLLEEQLRKADSRQVVKLSPTGIREVDEMSDAIEKLSVDVLDTGRRFSRIIRMASEDLGGFQLNEYDGSLFVTEGFFSVFGLDDQEGRDLTIPEFRKILDSLSPYVNEEESSAEATVYEFERNGKKQYIRLREMQESGII